jgi:hypothetical protein
MKVQMKVMSCLAILLGLSMATLTWASAGDILSSVPTGEPQIYGLEIRDDGGMTNIYAIVQHGMIYRIGVNSASPVRNGSQVAPDGKQLLTAVDKPFEGLSGLAFNATWEGPYATEFIGHIGLWSDDRSWRTRWGIEGDLGSLRFDQLGSGLYSDGDIAPVSLDIFRAGVWTTKEKDLLKFGYPVWGVMPSADYDLTGSLNQGEMLCGVTLGATDNELWLLSKTQVNAQDPITWSILQVSITNDTAVITSRFTLSSTINNPQGLVYDKGENTLWVSNMDFGSNPIYQISAGKPVLSVTSASSRAGYVAGETALTIANLDSTETMSWTAAVSSGSEWLSIVGDASGVDSGTVTLGVTENTGDTRTGTIVVTAPGAMASPKTITIVQSKKPAQAGDVLSVFSTGQNGVDGQVYGLAIRSMQDGTELHTAMGLRGAVYKYSVDSLNLMKDGGQETLLDSARMTDPNVNIMYFKGIAMPATTEGAYAALYIVNQDNRAVYRSRWGADLDGIPGALNFGMINGAWSLPSNADICEVSRTDAAYSYSIWATSDTTVSRYPSCIWSNTADKTFDLGTGLNGVALGNANDLWVLTVDRRIFQVSSENGTILKQFALSSEISQPSGIEFDAVAGSLWIGNLADNSIYQVAINVKSKIPGDANGDGAVDVGDLGILAANYGGTDKTWAQGDFNGDKAVDVGDLGILAANYGTNASNADWSADYAKAFGTTATDDAEDDSTTGSSICSGLGLPLIAALALMGLMLVKLEE